MLLQIEHFGKYARNTWKVLKCGAVEELKSVGRIVWKMKYYIGCHGGQERPTYNKSKEG